MRSVLRCIISVVIMGIFSGLVSASSPFAVFSKYLPDIAVTDIYQETKFVYMKVCNMGGVLADSERTLSLALGIAGGAVFQTVPVPWSVNSCHDFRIASIEELHITTSGNYTIAAKAVLKNGREEEITSNNRKIQSVPIVFPSKDLPEIPREPTYNISTSSSIYCTASNNYCATDSRFNSATTYYRNNICPP